MDDKYYDEEEDNRFQDKVDEGRFYDVVHSRAKSERCEHCEHYSRENIHEGYCNIKAEGVMKDSICSSLKTKGE